MKVLLSIFSVNEKILHIQKSLESLGCEVELIYSDAYRQVCPYYRKKLDELGLHSVGENIYNLYMIGFISYWKIFSQI